MQQKKGGKWQKEGQLDKIILLMNWRISNTNNVLKRKYSVQMPGLEKQEKKMHIQSFNTQYKGMNQKVCFNIELVFGFKGGDGNHNILS